MSLKRALNAVRSPFYKGNARFCPVCKKSSRKFTPHGIDARKGAKCMRCGALERHRLMWLFFERKSDLFDGKSKIILHIAPKPIFDKLFRSFFGKNYITADIYNPQAMIKMDITNIQYSDSSFDIIFCSHVLEHVQDDNQALREFHRVLKKGGWAIINVPVTVDKTYENPAITDPRKRLKHFGQEDHVRRYGPDYKKRLRKAGFNITVVSVADFLSEDERIKMGITDEAGVIYYCKKG